HLACQIGRAVAAIEGADIGVGLLEPAMLGRSDGEIGCDEQRMSAASRPSVNHCNDDLRHEPNQSLTFQNVQAGEFCFVDRRRFLSAGVRCTSLHVLVLVASATTDALIAARAERVLAVLLARAV